MRPLKTGDIVECIDRINSNQLIEGHLYYIKEVTPLHAYLESVSEGYAVGGGWFLNRFKLVEWEVARILCG